MRCFIVKILRCEIVDGIREKVKVSEMWPGVGGFGNVAGTGFGYGKMTQLELEP